MTGLDQDLGVAQVGIEGVGSELVGEQGDQVQQDEGGAGEDGEAVPEEPPPEQLPLAAGNGLTDPNPPDRLAGSVLVGDLGQGRATDGRRRPPARKVLTALGAHASRIRGSRTP